MQTLCHPEGALNNFNSRFCAEETGTGTTDQAGIGTVSSHGSSQIGYYRSDRKTWGVNCVGNALTIMNEPEVVPPGSQSYSAEPVACAAGRQQVATSRLYMLFLL